jgi:replicative DNA helicase
MPLTRLQQLAALGHAVTDIQMFEAVVALRPDLGPAAKTWDVAQQFLTDFHRLGSDRELMSLGADPDILTEARLACADIGFETLAPELKTSRTIEIVKTAYKDLDGQEDAEKIIDTMDKAVIAYRSVDESGVAYSTKTSAEWGEIEYQDRLKNYGKTLDTGIRFIDEISDGVAMNDLVIVAAKTGVGKSQMLAEIARNVANVKSEANLARVRDGGDPSSAFLLALEAYAGEMQRRLKWPTICMLWRQANPGKPHLDWGKFSNGRYRDELEPFEARAQELFAEKYTALHTLYRNSATFGIDEMERAIVRASKDHDLVLLDHLHYVDTDSEDRNVNEYGMQKKIVQKLREITLTKGRPIIAAAHFSKPEVGKFAAILPPMEKIMGSSDISKIATQVILLGNTSGLEEDAFTLPFDPGTLGLKGTVPTLVRLAKSRLYGAERTDIVAVCFFDRSAGQYRPQYLPGRLRSYGTKWIPMFADEIPGWASDAAIRLPRQAKAD